MFKAFKITLGIFAALVVVFVAVLIVGNMVEWVYRPAQHTVTLDMSKSRPIVPAWSEGLGAIGAPNAGLTYVKHDGRFYGADYCNTDGYGVPVGEIDREDGRNWLNDPDCKN